LWAALPRANLHQEREAGWVAGASPAMTAESNPPRQTQPLHHRPADAGAAQAHPA